MSRTISFLLLLVLLTLLLALAAAQHPCSNITQPENMERELPPWLNETFLATYLQGGEDKEPQITVKNFSARLAVAPGDNYPSHIFRVSLKYEIKGSEKSHTKSLMLNAPITKGFGSNMVTYG